MTAALLHTDRSVGATVTATAEVSTLPASFLLTPHISHRWHTPSGTTTASLTYDLGAAYDVGIVVLRGSNLTTNGTVRVEMSTVSDFSSLVYDSGAVTAAPYAPIGQIVRRVFPTQNVRYIRITLTDGTLDHLECGHVFLGEVFRPTYNIRYGYDFPLADDTLTSRSLGDAIWVDRRVVRRGIRVRFHHLSDAELYTLMDILRTTGLGNEIGLILDESSPNLSRDTYIGLMRFVPAPANTVLSYHVLDLELEERVA